MSYGAEVSRSPHVSPAWSSYSDSGAFSRVPGPRFVRVATPRMIPAEPAAAPGEKDIQVNFQHANFSPRVAPSTTSSGANGRAYQIITVRFVRSRISNGRYRHLVAAEKHSSPVQHAGRSPCHGRWFASEIASTGGRNDHRMPGLRPG